MKVTIFIILTGLFFNELYAASSRNLRPLRDKDRKVKKPLVGHYGKVQKPEEKKDEKYSIDFSSATQNKSSNETTLSSNIGDTLQLSATVEFFPDTFQLSLSYSHVLSNTASGILYNPLGYDDKTDFFRISIRPLYSEIYGDLVIGYRTIKHNTFFANEGSSPISIEQYDVATQTATVLGSLPVGQTLQAKDKMKVLFARYFFPENDLIPLGVYIGAEEMKKESVYLASYTQASVTTPKLLLHKGYAHLVGIGYKVDIDTLESDTLSLQRADISQGKFESSIPMKLFQYTLGVVYKIDAAYIGVEARISEVESDPFTYGTGTLTIPKQKDTFFTIHWGLTL